MKYKKMGVVRVKLIKEWEGIPAGNYVQVLDWKHRQMQETGFCADPDPELEALKKKSSMIPDASDVSEEE
jgi:hypothetical protein